MPEKLLDFLWILYVFVDFEVFVDLFASEHQSFDVTFEDLLPRSMQPFEYLASLQSAHLYVS